MKKCLAVLITLALLCSGLATPCFAGSALSDVEGTKYEKSAEFLYNIGIIAGYDDGTFKPERQVSRGELCAMVARMMGLADMSHSDSGRFSDIKDSIYKQYIENLAGLGIIDGMGNGLFVPDAPVQTEQAIKIVVCALGYNAFLNSNDKWPQNYINIASSRELMSNLSSRIGEPMPRGEIAILIENALNADALEKGSSINGSISFKDELVMKDFLDIDVVQGTFTANENADLLNGETSGTGMITITGTNKIVTANKGVLDNNADLGKKGKFYIKNMGEDDAVVVHFSESSNGNKTMTISSDDISEVIVSDYGENIQIEYYVNNRTKKEKLESGSKVFYNGKQVEQQDITEEIFNIDGGEITLMSYGDGKYNNVFITSYMSFAVNSVRLDENEIFVKPNSNKINNEQVRSLVLDPDDKYTTFKLTLDGKDITIEELKEFDILTVMTTMDKSVMEINVSRNSIEGSVTTLTENTEDGCSIDGTHYAISKGLNETLKVGDQGTFYLDSFGKIAYFDVNMNKNRMYGYLIKSYVEDNGEDYGVRLLSQTGKHENLKLKSKLSYNGSSRNAEDVCNLIGNNGTLIKYTTNSNGEITKIDTAVDNGSSEYVGYDLNHFSKDSNTADGSMYFKNTAIPGFNGRYLIDEDTVIFTVPSDATDYDNYRVANRGYFINDIFYNVDIYDTDRTMTAGVIVSRGIDQTKSDEQSLSWNEPVLVIDEIIQEVNEDDEIVDMIHGLKNGEEVSISVAEENIDGLPVLSDKYGDWQEVDPLTLKRGAVIQYKTNLDGEMDRFRILNMPDAPMRITNLDANSGNKIECQTVLGLVDVCRNGILKITLNEGATYNLATGKVYAIGNANIYRFTKNGKKEKIENADVEDILSIEDFGDSASKVFVRANKETVGDIVIYE